MPLGEITITFKVSAASAERVAKALCEPLGLEPNQANSKKVIKAMIEARILDVERQKKAEENEAANKPPIIEGIT